MATIRVTKQFKFEMAHALWNYDGPCKNIHGHSYQLYVTVKGSPINDSNNPKNGMVVDFGDLKRIVESNIIKMADHALFLSRDSQHQQFVTMPEMFDRLRIVDFQPTCENLVIYFADILKNKLPTNMILYCLKLTETATSYAEWFAEDN